MNSGAALTVANWSLTGGGTTTIAENLSYGGAFSAGALPTLAIDGGDTLTLTGTSTLGGGLSGAGALMLGGGATAINGAAALTVASWSISGVGTSATLGKSLTYGGSFSEGAGSKLNISGGDTLTLSGPTTLDGAVSGAGTLALSGATTLAGGAGTNVFAPAIVAAGAIGVTSGSFDFKGALSGAGGVTIGNGSTLEVDGAVAASQTFIYSPTGGQFALDDLAPSGTQPFQATISGFAAGDTLDIGPQFGSSATPVYNENPGGMSGTLMLTDGSAHASIAFLGNYSTANFAPTPDGHGGTLLTFHM